MFNVTLQLSNVSVQMCDIEVGWKIRDERARLNWRHKTAFNKLKCTSSNECVHGLELGMVAISSLQKKFGDWHKETSLGYSFVKRERKKYHFYSSENKYDEVLLLLELNRYVWLGAMPGRASSTYIEYVLIYCWLHSVRHLVGVDFATISFLGQAD